MVWVPGSAQTLIVFVLFCEAHFGDRNNVKKRYRKEPAEISKIEREVARNLDFE